MNNKQEVLSPARKRVETIMAGQGLSALSKKTAKTIKGKYGADYYAKIGSSGGKKSRKGYTLISENPDLMTRAYEHNATGRIEVVDISED